MGNVDRSDSLSKITSQKATVLAAFSMSLVRGVCACNTVYSVFKVQVREFVPSLIAAKTGVCQGI
ncbi:MAG: hypothetical protein LUG90_22240, partial [Clostridiaceae bacterium]|nr:hypothetical protein [Clostridiaceae bacterium]